MLKRYWDTLAGTVAIAIIFAIAAMLAPVKADTIAKSKNKIAAAEQPAAQTAAAKSWTGFYAGLHAGLAATSTDVDGMIELSGDGTQLGLHAGYDIQTGKIVSGVWAEYTWADIQTSFGGESATLKGSYAAGARVGYLVNDFLLAYVKGGWTQMEASSSFANMPKFDGYVAGGGLEALLSRSFAVRLEYLGSYLDSETVGGASFEPKSHAVRVGGSWRFDMPALGQ